MKYNFDQVVDRTGTHSVKWEAGEMLKEFGITERFDDDSIALWVADMDFKCPQPVIDAITERAQHGIFGYTIPNDSYFESFIDWSKTHYEWEIKQEWIKFMPGVVSEGYISATKSGFTLKVVKMDIKNFSLLIDTKRLLAPLK